MGEMDVEGIGKTDREKKVNNMQLSTSHVVIAVVLFGFVSGRFVRYSASL